MMGITYADKDWHGWYDDYVNAVWKMGLIEGSVTHSPNEAITLGQSKILIDKLITKYPNLQEYMRNYPLILKADEQMFISQFLELYKALLALIPEEDILVKNQVLFVLERELSEDGKDRIVTDIGRYYYKNTRDYEGYLTSYRESHGKSLLVKSL